MKTWMLQESVLRMVLDCGYIEWKRRGNGDLYYYDKLGEVSARNGEHTYELDTDDGRPFPEDEYALDLDILYDIEWKIL